MKRLAILFLLLGFCKPLTAGENRIELAVISTACGDLRYTVDPTTLREKDVVILREIFSYMVNGLNLTYDYPGLKTSRRDGALPEENVHHGPSKERILQLIKEPGFAKRAEDEWIEAFQNYPKNKLGSGIVQRLQDNFGIREFNGIHSDENCHAYLPF